MNRYNIRKSIQALISHAYKQSHGNFGARKRKVNAVSCLNALRAKQIKLNLKIKYNQFTQEQNITYRDMYKLHKFMFFDLYLNV